MPTLTIHLSEETQTKDIREELLGRGSRLVAETLGKPEDYVMVACNYTALSMGGVRGNAAFVELRSIGGLDAAINRRLSQDLCTLVNETTGVPPERIYINFLDVPRTDWGWNNKTFG